MDTTTTANATANANNTAASQSAGKQLNKSSKKIVKEKPVKVKVSKKKTELVVGEGQELKKRRRAKNFSNFNSFLYKLLKKQPTATNVGINKNALRVMNAFTLDMLDRVAREAQKIAKINRMATVTQKHVEHAVKLLLPSDLAQHACAAGARATALYAQSVVGVESKA